MNKNIWLWSCFIILNISSCSYCFWKTGTQGAFNRRAFITRYWIEDRANPQDAEIMEIILNVDGQKVVITDCEKIKQVQGFLKTLKYKKDLSILSCRNLSDIELKSLSSMEIFSKVKNSIAMIIYRDYQRAIITVNGDILGIHIIEGSVNGIGEYDILFYQQHNSLNARGLLNILNVDVARKAP